MNPETRLFINGELCEAENAAQYDNISPVTEQVIGQAADAKATALPDGVVDHPVMLGQYIAVGVDDIAGVGGFGAQFADHRGVVAIRNKADILTVGLVGDT